MKGEVIVYMYIYYLLHCTPHVHVLLHYCQFTVLFPNSNRITICLQLQEIWFFYVKCYMIGEVGMCFKNTLQWEQQRELTLQKTWTSGLKCTDLRLEFDLYNLCIFQCTKGNDYTYTYIVFASTVCLRRPVVCCVQPHCLYLATIVYLLLILLLSILPTLMSYALSHCGAYSETSIIWTLWS